MALDLRAIHEALAEQIGSYVARPTNVYPFDPGDGARQYPAIVIDPGEPWVTYHETFGDNALQAITFAVRVLIVAAELDQRIALADYASDGSTATSSIRAAIESDMTFGGTVARSVCRSCSGIEDIGGGVLAVTFDVAADAHRGGS